MTFKISDSLGMIHYKHLKLADFFGPIQRGSLINLWHLGADCDFRFLIFELRDSRAAQITSEVEKTKSDNFKCF